jgi:hypothetical protein
MRAWITLVEALSAEPAWITQIFSMPEMARETFVINGAELDVAIMGLNIPDEEHPVGLRGLETPEALRGQGVASGIYRALIAGADRYGRPLELDAYPYEMRKLNADGKATPEQVLALVNYLRRMGFTTLLPSPNLTRPVAMVYRPKNTAPIN